MIEVMKIAVSRLLKTEVQLLLRDTVRILEKHDPELLRLKDVLHILKKQEEKIHFFTMPHKGHVLTVKLDQLRKKRLKCASLIAGQVSSLEKSFLSSIQHNAETVKFLSDTYLTYLGQMNQYDIDMQIMLFFSNLKESPEEQAAFQALGLQPYLDELQKLNEACRDTTRDRSRNIKDRPPTGDRALERETQRILRMFFDHVNYTQQIFKDTDYTPFISRLNAELTICSKNIKTRIATNKRRAKKKKAAAEKAAADAAKKASDESLTEGKDYPTPLDLKPPNGGVDGDNNSKSNKNERREKPKGGEDKKEEEPE